ncbi:MAG: hypothetical protein IJD07_00425 [Clostridia bacterium]|nr:hypothetical protein [Clostridia bacterium]
MTFKNAFRILTSRFSLVWSVLLYLIVFGIIIASLVMSFLLPIINTLKESGIFDKFYQIIKTFASEGSWSVLYKGIEQTVKDLAAIYSSDKQIVINSTLLLTVVLLIVGRFLLGFYELPLIANIEARMSANAKLSYAGCIISHFKKSCKFILVKMIYTIVFDLISLALIFGAYKLLKTMGIIIAIPFVVMLLIVLTQGVRYSLKALCAPAAVMEQGKTVKNFLKAISLNTSVFVSAFSTYIIAWLLIISLNILVFFLTFGVGLLVSIPACMVFLSVLDMTFYFRKKELRYYVDDNNIYTPKKPKAE